MKFIVKKVFFGLRAVFNRYQQPTPRSRTLFHFFTFSLMTGRFLKIETDRILGGDATGESDE